MRKFSCCRLQLLLTAILLLSIVVFTESCRKADTAFVTPQIFSETENKFFNSHRSGDAREKALVDFLKRRNKSSHFVETAVKRIGYPRWNKAITITDASILQGRTESGAGNVTTTYIPFVRDSQNYVNASLIIKTSATDTNFFYHCDWQYAQKQNSTSSVTDSAEYFAVFFMVLNKYVFGHDRFAITDNSLFSRQGQTAVSVRLAGASNSFQTDLLVPVEVCQEITVYTQDCGWPGYCRGPGGSCDNCTFCVKANVFEFCWTEYVDDGTSPGGGGGSGGSGNGGGNPPDDDPPPCDGLPVGLAGRVYDPCDPGWEIIPIDDPPVPHDPCVAAKPGSDKATFLSKNDKFTSALTDIKAAASDGKEHAASFGKDANGNIIRSVVSTGTGNSGSVPNIENRFADMHNHPGNKPPSSGDIYGFIDQAALKGSSYQRFVTLPNGVMYALIITDMQAAKKFNTDNPRRPGIGGNEPTFPEALVEDLTDLNYYTQSPENGLAFFLDKYKTGISLLKLDTDEKFKRVNVTYAGKDQYGSDIYNVSLCN